MAGHFRQISVRVLFEEVVKAIQLEELLSETMQ